MAHRDTASKKTESVDAYNGPAEPKPGWMTRRPLLFVSLLAVVIGAVYVAGFAGCRTPEFSDGALCKNSLSQPWATLIAGTLVLLGAILTYLSTEKTRSLTREELKHTQDEAERVHQRQVESALNDRFVSAVEQLGNKEQHPVKLGGVYSLIALAEDWVAFGNQSVGFRYRAKKQAQVCVDVLCSYVKSNTHRDATPEVIGAIAGRKRGAVSRPESDFRAVIFRVLMATRQHVSRAMNPHPLSWTRLNFDGADMTGVSMGSIEGENISLIGSNLSEADLSLSKWFFGNFQATKLAGTDLSGADLRGACMEGADFQGVDLMNANIEGAHVDDAHLIGADLSRVVGLTTEQAGEAHCWDLTTSWPEGVMPPSEIRSHKDEGGD